MAHEEIIKREDGEYLIALAGSPNVGKSTVFNALTGMKQHTGNWAGKTVSSASGRFEWEGRKFILADIPGTYSLRANSAEEECAGDFICFGRADAAIVVCDATCLERNLNLAIQTIEAAPRTLLCVNLMDEAESKGIHIDFQRLEEILGVPAVGVTARSGKGLDELARRLCELVESEPPEKSVYVAFPEELEKRALEIEKRLGERLTKIPLRLAALQLLERDSDFTEKAEKYEGFPYSELVEDCELSQSGEVTDAVISAVIGRAEYVAGEAVSFEVTPHNPVP